MRRMDEPAVSVLMSLRRPTPTTNPYVSQLAASLPEDVSVTWFSWSAGLLGRYEVFHVHWPEVLVRRSTRARTLLAQVRFAALMLRLQLTRTPVVRTLHNPGSHEAGRPTEVRLLAWCDRLTRHWVLLNAETPSPAGRSTVVLHGHYRDWYRGVPVPPSRPGRLLFFGLVRPYKGVERLLVAFRGLDDARASLRIVGRAADPEVGRRVSALVDADERTAAVLGHADDATLAAELGRAQLVVLPYEELHNSGAVLLALSLGRPVLVPSTPTTDALAQEVGQEWVLRYRGALQPGDLAAGLAAVHASTNGGAPDLSQREWPGLGRQHGDVYEAERNRRAVLRDRHRRTRGVDDEPDRE